jgi:hypothetical protein
MPSTRPFVQLSLGEVRIREPRARTRVQCRKTPLLYPGVDDSLARPVRRFVSVFLRNCALPSPRARARVQWGDTRFSPKNAVLNLSAAAVGHSALFVRSAAENPIGRAPARLKYSKAQPARRNGPIWGEKMWLFRKMSRSVKSVDRAFSGIRSPLSTYPFLGRAKTKH